MRILTANELRGDALNYDLTTDDERDYPQFNYDKAIMRMAMDAGKYCGENNLRTEISEKRRKEFKSAERIGDTEIYRLEKERLDKMLANPNVDALIPKKYWTDFTLLIGDYIRVSTHAHSLYAQQKMLEIVGGMKRADVLLVTTCTASKPYSSVGRNQRFIKCSNETRLFDVLIASVIPTFITPFDASVCYPIANYSVDGDINVTSYNGNNISNTLFCKHFVEIIRRLGYKKIIFIHAGHLDARITRLRNDWGLNEKIMIEPYRFPVYKWANEFVFSTRELPVPKTFYHGASIVRFIGSSAVSCFMRDVFGPAVFPYFKVGWEHIDDKVKEYAGYSEQEIKEIVEYVDIKTKSPLDAFFW